jgi:hypothetical protein
MNNYSINNGSQSAWNESDPQSAFNKYNEQLQALIRGGTVIASTQITSGSPLYLQTLNSTSINVNIGTGDEQAAKYPEGRVWVVNSPSVSIPANMTVTYHGVGTLIIKGNLIIGDHAKIVAGDPKVDKLGIVVLQ